jgi:hypothetical protein
LLRFPLLHRHRPLTRWQLRTSCSRPASLDTACCAASVAVTLATSDL